MSSAIGHLSSPPQLSTISQRKKNQHRHVQIVKKTKNYTIRDRRFSLTIHHRPPLSVKWTEPLPDAALKMPAFTVRPVPGTEHDGPPVLTAPLVLRHHLVILFLHTGWPTIFSDVHLSLNCPDDPCHCVSHPWIGLDRPHRRCFPFLSTSTITMMSSVTRIDSSETSLQSHELLDVSTFHRHWCICLAVTMKLCSDKNAATFVSMFGAAFMNLSSMSVEQPLSTSLEFRLRISLRAQSPFCFSLQIRGTLRAALDRRGHFHHTGNLCRHRRRCRLTDLAEFLVVPRSRLNEAGAHVHRPLLPGTRPRGPLSTRLPGCQ